MSAPALDGPLSESSDAGLGSKPFGRVFLPFEGDTTLSIIVSKALLLADDRRITDPIIVSQIPGR